ncbi:hypothetical protein L3V77_09835 [Vibrio sp. DW001]|uniref:hypothetical protein n=1 Tax=Vibrio sp. DW001 TaxID=2912315 RepID=UPI0023AEBE0E|nr:hypothetical protein [Vibrio sp. DW001]WED25372.1 hypothetical protein L3V77_09835 [Vibrio sp. DW001]
MHDQDLVTILESIIADSKLALSILCDQPSASSRHLIRDLKMLESRVVDYCKAHSPINPNDVIGDAQSDGIVKRERDDPDVFISTEPKSTTTKSSHGFICPYGKCEISIKPK